MPDRRRLLALVVPALLSSCASGTLYAVPTTLQMDGWTITVQRLQDGPSSWIEPVVPGPTHGPLGVRGTRSRLLHLWLSVRNDAPVERWFPYDACDLDGGPKLFVPGLVIMSVWNDVRGLGESYRPGEELRRELIYWYPDGPVPTRIRCGYAVWAMPRR